jgi:hypothetical protein
MARIWEMALLPNQDPSALPPGESYGYGVDSGKGCFLDARTMEKLEPERQLYSQRNQRLWDEPRLINLDAIQQLRTPFFRRLDAETIEAGRDWADLVVDPETGANLVVFSSGYGDGGYPSYWGLDSGGEVSCLVTDFGILLTPLKATVKLPLREDRRQVVSHPDLEQMGLRCIRVRRSRDGVKVRLELEGRHGFMEQPVFESGRKKYRHRAGFIQGDVMEFTLEEPLPPKARLVIRCVRGVRAL